MFRSFDNLKRNASRAIICWMTQDLPSGASQDTHNEEGGQASPFADPRNIKRNRQHTTCAGVSVKRRCRLRQWNWRLLLVGLQRSFVTGFFDGCDELVGVSFAFFDLHDGLIWMCDLRADHSRNFFKCGPHFFYAVNLSDHARNGQVHSLLFRRFGCLKVARLGDGNPESFRGKGVSCRQHRCKHD